MTAHQIKSWWSSIFLLIIFINIRSCFGHGRLIEPPSRASAWRYGFQTPPDYNDHELYCGGFTRQWKRNNGKCGVCGDAWDLKEPRPHENGGQWGQGVVVRKYLPGTEMTICVELTASHMGYFEFRICPEPDADQDCLDKHLLKLLGGSPSQPAPTDLETRFYPRNGSRIYEIKAELPDIKCDQCVLQWRYIAGNNWGMCPDGNGAVGCGPQEEFRSCADIALGEGAHTPIRPMRPSPKTTVRPRFPSTSTETTTQEHSDGSSSVWTILLVFLILIATCALGAWYLFKYHNQKVQEWLRFASNKICWNQSKQNSKSTIMQTTTTISSLVPSKPYEYNNEHIDAIQNDNIENPPIPPPRVKRNSKVKEILPDEPSIY